MSNTPLLLILRQPVTEIKRPLCLYDEITYAVYDKRGIYEMEEIVKKKCGKPTYDQRSLATGKIERS